MATIKINSQSLKDIKEICRSFNNDKGELINVLHTVQNKFGYLPAEVQKVIAEELRIPVSKVYGVVSFYSFFTMTPKGKYPIAICLGTACYVRGAEGIVDKVKEALGIEVGQTTPDGLFTLDCLRCIGACGLAPVIRIGDDVYGKCTPAKAVEIINSYKAREV